jgi:hypothetical protein
MFLLRAVLAERPATGGLGSGLEDRVVAEAAAPARRGRDPAAAGSPPAQESQAPGRRRIRDREAEHAHVPGAASRRRQARELRQQLRVVLGIGGVRAGKAAGPDPGPAIEGVDLDPRVVGQGRQAGRASREAGLDPGVRLERLAVLDRLALDAEVVERDELDLRQREELAQLAQLVARARRDDEPRAPGDGAQRRTFASASACASNSLPRPRFARSSSSSTRVRSNGAPSAVPWSSTYVPASVPTTLKSTAAWESSG